MWSCCHSLAAPNQPTGVKANTRQFSYLPVDSYNNNGKGSIDKIHLCFSCCKIIRDSLSSLQLWTGSKKLFKMKAPKQKSGCFYENVRKIILRWLLKSPSLPGARRKSFHRKKKKRNHRLCSLTVSPLRSFTPAMFLLSPGVCRCHYCWPLCCVCETQRSKAGVRCQSKQSMLTYTLPLSPNPLSTQTHNPFFSSTRHVSFTHSGFVLGVSLAALQLTGYNHSFLSILNILLHILSALCLFFSFSSMDILSLWLLPLLVFHSLSLSLSRCPLPLLFWLHGCEGLRFQSCLAAVPAAALIDTIPGFPTAFSSFPP